MNNIINERSVGSLFRQALDKKLISGISKKHQDNLRQVYNHFMIFLGDEGRERPIQSLTTGQIEIFLQRFNTSATHYMNKRRALSVHFNTACRLIDENLMTVKKTEVRRIKATLNLAYEQEQLRPVLGFLKAEHTNLYRCADDLWVPVKATRGDTFADQRAFQSEQYRDPFEWYGKQRW